MENKKRSGKRFVRGLEVEESVAVEVAQSGAMWLPLVAEQFFAGHLRQEREARGMTQAALARALTLRDVPLSQSAIAKLEREDDATRRPIRLVEAAAIASFLGRSLDDMITKVPPESEQHRAYLEARQAESDAYHEVQAATRALADAEAAAEAAKATREAVEAAWSDVAEGDV